MNDGYFIIILCLFLFSFLKKLLKNYSCICAGDISSLLVPPPQKKKKKRKKKDIFLN
jgi:hypothetical protein